MRPHDAFLETVRGGFMHDGRLAERIATYGANGRDEINGRVSEMATAEDVTMAQVALAWLLHQDAVTAPIVGTTSVEHLEDVVEALEIDLSDSDLEYLAEPYGPVDVDGHE